MSYYLISKYVNEHKLLKDQLTNKVFDYILLEEGDLDEVSQNSRINNKILKKMREEFEYFYPVDSRHSGRDLVPNHLTFFIFNHSAIFPEENWPRQIVVNGSVLMDGKKMSKSFGNIIPLREAVKTYGADPLRLAILATAELLQDADISLNLVKTFNERLERIYGTIVWAIEKRGHLDEKEFRVEDRWMLSRLQMIIKQSTDALEKLRCREAIHNIIYLADQDVQWYLRRTKVNLDKKRTVIITAVIYEVIQTRIKLLAPFAPFISEEIWELMGNRETISLATWPKLENSKIDIEAEEGEELVKNLLEDTLNIVRVTNIKPKKVTYYTASNWKWKVYLEMLHLVDTDSLDMRSLMTQIMQKKEIKKRAKEVSLFTKKLIEEVKTVPLEMRKRRLTTKILNELNILKTATDFLENEFGAEVSILSEDDPNKYDPRSRSGQSKPYRPAIFIE
tara:strand:- start:650 stop:1999 length:1350 start_codon:yes stop_codon:yes gene_type:complete